VSYRFELQNGSREKMQEKVVIHYDIIIYCELCYLLVVLYVGSFVTLNKPLLIRDLFLKNHFLCVFHLRQTRANPKELRIAKGECFQLSRFLFTKIYKVKARKAKITKHGRFCLSKYIKKRHKISFTPHPFPFLREEKRFLIKV
jgi:hypothetical protein